MATLPVTRAPITINDSRPDMPEADNAHTMATIAKAMTYTNSPTVEKVTVYLNARGVYASTPDWLEHVIRVHYVTPGRAPFTIGAIQRTPDSPSEFAS